MFQNFECTIYHSPNSRIIHIPYMGNRYSMIRPGSKMILFHLPLFRYSFIPLQVQSLHTFYWTIVSYSTGTSVVLNTVSYSTCTSVELSIGSHFVGTLDEPLVFHTLQAQFLPQVHPLN